MPFVSLCGGLVGAVVAGLGLGSARAGAVVGLLAMAPLAVGLAVVAVLDAGTWPSVLGGVALVLVVVVDDAVVATEGVLRQLESGSQPRRAGWRAAAEVVPGRLAAAVAVLPALVVVAPGGIAAAGALAGSIIVMATGLRRIASIGWGPTPIGGSIIGADWIAGHFDRLEDRYHDLVASVVDHSTLVGAVAFVVVFVAGVLVATVDSFPSLPWLRLAAGFGLGLVALNWLTGSWAVAAMLTAGALSPMTLVLGAAVLVRGSVAEASIAAVSAFIVTIRGGFLLAQATVRRYHRAVPPRVALVEASRAQVRPVVVATMAGTASLVPMVIGDGSRTVGAVTAGAVVVAAFATLLLVPSLLAVAARWGWLAQTGRRWD